MDLGTAYLVRVGLDEDGLPLAGEWLFAQVVRDGLVVDFIGAADLLRGMKARVARRIGRTLEHAASGYPPGVPKAEVRATAHLVQSAGLDCTGLPTTTPPTPALITPLDLARHDCLPG